VPLHDEYYPQFFTASILKRKHLPADEHFPETEQPFLFYPVVNAFLQKNFRAK
jgi:hypothetical protein